MSRGGQKTQLKDQVVRIISAIEFGVGEGTSALEDEDDLQPVWRLGLCKPRQKRYAAVLAKVYLSRLHQASSGQNRLTEAYRLAHVSSHTFGTILNANGENPKVIQELLRHATLKVTMDTYVQAVSDEKRNAQSKVVEMLLPGIRRAVR